MQLVNIGFGSMLSAQRILAALEPESAPIKRMVQEARDRGTLIDAAYGRETKTEVLMDTEHMALAALAPETIGERWQSADREEEKE